MILCWPGRLRRQLVGWRSLRSGLIACVTICILLVVTLTSVRDESPRRPTTPPGGLSAWEGLPTPAPAEEQFWLGSFDLYASAEMRALRSLLQPYLNALRRLRYSLLSANHTWTGVDEDWLLLNGYDKDYFPKVSVYPQVHTLQLTANFSVVARSLPAPRFYDYGGFPIACTVMTSKCRAIYSNGDELLNRSCRSNLHQTLLPSPVDRTLLSLGLPFTLDGSASHDDVILTFINVVQNGVITAHGEVLSGNVGIMTQRCSHSWYKPTLPPNAEDLPIYDEVLTITQQVMVWYYHNTIEDLPRVAPYLELLRDNPHIKIHITRAGFHEKMLAYLGLGPERLVSGAVRARIAYLPAGTTCGRPPVFNTQLLAAMFRQRISTSISRASGEDGGGGDTGSTNGSAVPMDTIVVIRRSSPNRQFRHHDAIVNMLHDEAAPRGLKVEVFRDDPPPPLTAYMRLFHRARLVVAPHGAGLANLLFARPGTLVLEGLCEMEPQVWLCFYGYMPWLCYSWYSRVSLSFRNLATVLGQHYVGVTVEAGCLYVQPGDLQAHVRFYLDHLR